MPYILTVITLLFRIVNKKRGQITSSTFLEVSANTHAAYTSKSPRIQREHQLSLLLLLIILPNYEKQELKANASSNMSAQPSTLVDIRMDAAKIVNKIDSVELKFHNSYFLMHNFDNSCVFIFKNSTFCSLNQDNMWRKRKNMGKTW